MPGILSVANNSSFNIGCEKFIGSTLWVKNIPCHSLADFNNSLVTKTTVFQIVDEFIISKGLILWMGLGTVKKEFIQFKL